jgi:hypothetical protein
MKKAAILFLLLTLSGCDSEKEILCDKPVYTSGNMKIVNRQCIYFGDHIAAMIELEDETTKQHYHYTMNIVNDKVIFNLSTAQAVSISNSEQAAASSSFAVGMASANMASSGGRR